MFSSINLLQVLDDSLDYHSPPGLQQPPLNLLCSLLNAVINSLERAVEEKSLLLNKVLLDCLCIVKDHNVLCFCISFLSFVLCICIAFYLSFLHVHCFFLLGSKRLCVEACALITFLSLQIRDINELSRQEVDEVINMCVRKDLVSASDDTQKRYLFGFALPFVWFYLFES